MVEEPLPLPPPPTTNPPIVMFVAGLNEAAGADVGQFRSSRLIEVVDFDKATPGPITLAAQDGGVRGVGGKCGDDGRFEVIGRRDAGRDDGRFLASSSSCRS
jgi:hypothetical protein